MRDMYHDIAYEASMLFETLTNGTKTGDAVDTTGFHEVGVAVLYSVQDGSHVVKLEHSDDGSTWEEVQAEDLIGTLPTLTSGSGVAKVAYIGQKRYVRGKVETSGATNGMSCSYLIVLTHPLHAPVE